MESLSASADKLGVEHTWPREIATLGSGGSSLESSWAFELVLCVLVVAPLAPACSRCGRLPL
eukprot:4724215-Pyramimonas_sp.AAC.1